MPSRQRGSSTRRLLSVPLLVEPDNSREDDLLVANIGTIMKVAVLLIGRFPTIVEAGLAELELRPAEVGIMKRVEEALALA